MTALVSRQREDLSRAGLALAELLGADTDEQAAAARLLAETFTLLRQYCTGGKTK